MSADLVLRVGIKTDPIEYRYSFPWLFRLLAEEGVRHVQLGTFFELYHLPDEALRELRRLAEDHGLRITSVFTAHRELGGFFRGDPAWEVIARRAYERLIAIGGILGARSVGSNPGAVPRDEIDRKARGIATYVRHMEELLHHAHRAGVARLTMEPMSSLAEPPALPEEIRALVEPLRAYHEAHPDETASIGLCVDTSHGYVDRGGRVVHDPAGLLDAALPYTTEIHLKNTDAALCSTFGFDAEGRRRGIVDLAAVRDLLLERAGELPVGELIGYLEIPGPKRGRDHTDPRLEGELRASLRHARERFAVPRDAAGRRERDPPGVRGERSPPSPVAIAPSLMCADMNRIEEEVRRLEACGCPWLHFDIMDAHFVPNMPIGLELVGAVRRITTLPFDVHLMVEDNDFFVERLAEIGVQRISVHCESSTHLDRTLERIRAIGAEAGAALNPATPLAAIEYVLERLDFLLLMTVNPGYAGQTLVPSALRKIADARRFLRARGRAIPIEVDGNVSFEHIPAMVAAGADVLVAGTSSVYHRGGSRAENVARVRRAIEEGLARRGEPDDRGHGRTRESER